MLVLLVPRGGGIGASLFMSSRILGGSCMWMVIKRETRREKRKRKKKKKRLKKKGKVDVVLSMVE